MSTGEPSPSLAGSEARMTIRVESTSSTTPARRETTVTPESRATTPSIPVPTMGALEVRSGTAWRCMFEPIRARLASSCSRKGISDAATDTSWLGETSIKSTLEVWTIKGSPACRASTISVRKRPF